MNSSKPSEEKRTASSDLMWSPSAIKSPHLLSLIMDKVTDVGMQTFALLGRRTINFPYLVLDLFFFINRIDLSLLGLGCALITLVHPLSHPRFPVIPAMRLPDFC